MIDRYDGRYDRAIPYKFVPTTTAYYLKHKVELSINKFVNSVPVP